ncbi:hypothetical protein NMY22_g3798 [Coprinellus aureogranulatus]|nr:hypothetical protein NMY22_g3798 [Coprinellus aureogranulatus]
MSDSTRKSYRPPNVPPAFYENQKYGFVGVQVALVFYGIAASLFIQCFTAHIQSFSSSPSSSFSAFKAAYKSATLTKKLQLGYVIVLFACGTIVIVADAWANVVATMDYPLYPGGSYMWAITHFSEPIFMLGQVPFQVTTWLADGFMLYRCYVIYTMTAGLWFILLLPVLLYLGAIGTGIALIVQGTLPLLSVFNLIKITLANFSITASLNMLITALIALRLVLHSISMRRTMESDATSLRMYTSLWTILVESSALYALFSLLFIVTYAIDHPASKMFLPILGQVQVIAPLLVSLRLSKEMAWTKHTSRSVVAGAVSSVQFGNPARQGSSPSEAIETHLSFASHGQAESTNASNASSSQLEHVEKIQPCLYTRSHRGAGVQLVSLAEIPFKYDARRKLYRDTCLASFTSRHICPFTYHITITASSRPLHRPTRVPRGSWLLVPDFLPLLRHPAMNRGPIILTIDEAEYLLDQLPPPSPDDDDLAQKLRARLQDLLTALREGAEGTMKG